MPSADDGKTYLFKVMPETTQDFLTHDVDLLVSQIKDNLRLSAGLKAKSSVSQKTRSSPYLVPSRSEIRRSERAAAEYKRVTSNNKTEDDPYETLREFLKQGRLINEAVKKLQTMHFDDLSNSEVEDDDDDDDDDTHDNNVHQQHRGYRRKTYYYDSEDEPLPSVYQSLDL